MKRLFKLLSTASIVLTIVYGLVYLPELFGYHKLIIESDYMEPYYSKNSIIYYYEADLSSIKDTDIITFKKDDVIKSGVVIGINNGEYKVREGSKEEKVSGKVILGKNLHVVIKHLGAFINFVNNNTIICIIILIASETLNIIFSLKKDKNIDNPEPKSNEDNKKDNNHKKVLEIDE